MENTSRSAYFSVSLPEWEKLKSNGKLKSYETFNVDSSLVVMWQKYIINKMVEQLEKSLFEIILLVYIFSVYFFTTAMVFTPLWLESMTLLFNAMATRQGCPYASFMFYFFCTINYYQTKTLK